MQVTKTLNEGLPFVMHQQGGVRQYRVSFVGYEKPYYDFSYKERSVKQYTFDGDFAISGSRQNGLWGIVQDNRYYYDEWSKLNKDFYYDSDFWDSFNDTINLHLDGKNTKKFDTDVNLWFSVGAYWHWFAEDIPLIEQLRTNNYPIITNHLAPWQKDSLSFFPDILNRLIELPTPVIIQAPRYHCFTYPAISMRGRTSHWVPTFLHNSFTPSQSFKPTKKIYISRGDAVARMVENEHEVRTYLESQGFECYNNFSSLSIQQKVDVFAQAQLVVAPTGANLTHCHAMQPGTTVLDFNHEFELCAESGWNSLGVGVGVNWYTFPAKTGEKGPRSRKGKKIKNNQLIVDMSLLKKALSAIC